MKRYEIQLFSGEGLLYPVIAVSCNGIIQALERFTEMCESGREDYALDDYQVWLYDPDNIRNVMFYTYLQDDDYGTYEELTPCQY